MMSENRFISPQMEERLRKGTFTSSDLNRAFSLTKRDTDAFARRKYEGATGVVFSLEGVLVDLREAFRFAYSVLADDLRREQPTVTQVNDIIGAPFGETLLALQWGVPLESTAAVEKRFDSILTKVLEALPLTTYIGSEALIDELVRGGNQVVINTQLSRELAVKVIGKSKLSEVLEGRVGGENLVFPSPEYRVTYRGQQLIRCCGVMRKPTTLVVSVDSNSRTLLDAKRDGLSCVAVKGLAANAQSLRSADKVVDSLAALRAKDLYHLVERAVQQEDGPLEQTSSDGAMQKLHRQQVASPAQFENDRPKDTFAEEGPGADTM